jgi:NAD(P)-dependent dehydrogenase (short-subunit alcohol dehydrogenase family)
VLVNTIGAFGQGDALSTTPEQLGLMLDVNVAVTLWPSQAAARHIQRQGPGAMCT